MVEGGILNLEWKIFNVGWGYSTVTGGYLMIGRSFERWVGIFNRDCFF